jgi:uncharacterized protein
MIINRLLLFFGIIVSGSFVACAQNTAPVQAPEDSLYVVQNFRLQKVMIPMRDGVQLYTEIMIPNDASRTRQYPMLMSRTPYNAANFMTRFYDRPSYTRLLREGYIIVIQDVRGRWRSAGDFVHTRPQVDNPNKRRQKQPDESTDTYDTIDWLVKNVTGNNGNVGVYGVSYPGFYSTTAALSNHPALKAVSPQAPVTEWFIGDDVHHKGAFFWMDFFTFLPRFHNDDPDGESFNDFGVLPFTAPDNYEYFLRTVQTPRLANERFFKDRIPFWNDIMANPDYNEFWRSRNPLPHARELRPAMLTIGGWYDAENLFGALETYQKLEKQNPQTVNKLVMGPWCHGCWWADARSLGDMDFGSATGNYFLDSLFLPFMDFHLKGRGNAPQLAEATVFQTGANQWRKFTEWPPRNTQERSLYLQPGGQLSFEAPAASGAFSEYVSDPASPVPYQDGIHWQRTREYMLDDQRFASRRPDVLTFQTGPLTEDLTLAGPIIADLIASISTTDADFVVKVIDVYPDDTPNEVAPEGSEAVMGGYQHLVRAEILRGRYRNSFEKPEAFQPNQPTPVRYELPDVFHTFRRGHRLMVQIQSSWFPLADRNPQQFINIYQAKPEDYIKSSIRIHHNTQQPSRLQVRVMAENR